MKKTYINPTIEVINIDTKQTLMAGSPGALNLDTSNPITSGDEVGGHELNLDDDFGF